MIKLIKKWFGLRNDIVNCSSSPVDIRPFINKIGDKLNNGEARIELFREGIKYTRYCDMLEGGYPDIAYYYIGRHARFKFNNVNFGNSINGYTKQFQISEDGLENFIPVKLTKEETEYFDECIKRFEKNNIEIERPQVEENIKNYGEKISMIIKKIEDEE